MTVLQGVPPDFQAKVDSASSAEPARAQPRRLRGLRFPVLPTGAWLAQVGGGGAVLTGAYLQWGMAVALMVAGAAALVLGTLREAGKI